MILIFFLIFIIINNPIAAGIESAILSRDINKKTTIQTYNNTNPSNKILRLGQFQDCFNKIYPKNYLYIYIYIFFLNHLYLGIFP